MLQFRSVPNSGKSVTKKLYRSRRPRLRGGVCTAAVRSFTAATLYRENKVPTLMAAAMACGSSVQYVNAALTLLASENSSLIDEVLDGHVALLPAAKQVKQLATLIEAYRRASPDERAAFGQTIGPGDLWDQSLAPIL